jgi:hypothetical protein
MAARLLRTSILAPITGEHQFTMRNYENADFSFSSKCYRRSPGCCRRRVIARNSLYVRSLNDKNP